MNKLPDFSAMTVEDLRLTLDGARAMWSANKKSGSRDGMRFARQVGEGAKAELATRAPCSTPVETLIANLDRLNDSDRLFAESLLGARHPSEKQLHWIGVLADRATEVQAEPERAVAVSYLPLVEFLDRASDSGLKFPKINLEDAGGNALRLTRAGSGSREPGSITLSEAGYGTAYYGRISRDGTYHKTRETKPWVIELLSTLSEHPEQIAKAHGQRTGNCCFCSRDLSDYRSVSMGYGPICAERWGLPWGEVEGSPSEYTETAA